jgi:hypothetical protein
MFLTNPALSVEKKKKNEGMEGFPRFTILLLLFRNYSCACFFLLSSVAINELN